MDNKRMYELIDEFISLGYEYKIDICTPKFVKKSNEFYNDWSKTHIIEFRPIDKEHNYAIYSQNYYGTCMYLTVREAFLASEFAKCLKEAKYAKQCT